MDSSAFNKLRRRLTEIAYLRSMYSVLEWDQNVNVPPGGHEARADLIGYVQGLAHEKFISSDFESTLLRAEELAENGSLNDEEKLVISKTRKNLDKAKKIPVEFVEISECFYAQSHPIWVKARDRSDFSIFEKNLLQIVAYQRKKAEYLSGRWSYDTLMDDYEPGMSSARVENLFRDLKNYLIPLVNRIKCSKTKINKKFLSRKYPLDKQSRFINIVASQIGFDLKRGRIDTSVHPFCSSFHPTDVRLTTRFNERNFISDALMSVIHEAGHGMYEQGLRAQWYGTSLGEAASLGVHESQSRLWENQVGHSLQFWNCLFPELKKEFSAQLKNVSLIDFYRAINVVEPGFIRVDADEVTYNLHVILRFEIERDLIEGKLEVGDLPNVWNGKVKEYLSLNVPNDAKGVLQDVHWSCGSFGYFHTYALGNVYAAQEFAAAREAIPSLYDEMTPRNLLELKKWLNENIHIHGERYMPEELIFKATGKEVNPDDFKNYITIKYSDIYNI